MRKLLLASVVIAASGGTALAADAVPPAPAPIPTPPVVVPTFDWTGPYVGFYGGYGFGYSAATGQTSGAFNETVTGLTLPVQPRGFLGGVTVGYNLQTGGFVFGVEGNAGYLSLNGTTTFNGGLPADDPTVLDDDTGTVNYGWYGTLAARLGLALDRTLVFATAGGVVTQFSSVYGDLDPPAPGTLNATDATMLGGPQFGYVLGGGAEFAFDTNWTAKLEYNYFNLGTDTTGNGDGETYTQRNSAHLVRFGLNYLFNY